MVNVVVDNGKVQCPECKEYVSPRLWFSDQNSLFFDRASKHICPICGVTMYETGGGVTGIFKVGVCFTIFVVFWLFGVNGFFGIFRNFGMLKNDAVFYSQMGAFYLALSALYVSYTLLYSRGVWDGVRRVIFVILTLVTFFVVLLICVHGWFAWNEERGVFKDRNFGFVDLLSLFVCIVIALLTTWIFSRVFGIRKEKLQNSR